VSAHGFALSPVHQQYLTQARQMQALSFSAHIPLVAGIGLLNVADAGWAHTVGVVALFGFIVAAFLAIVPAVLSGEDTPAPPASE
jgi:hypothetical protein